METSRSIPLLVALLAVAHPATGQPAGAPATPLAAGPDPSGAGTEVLEAPRWRVGDTWTLKCTYPELVLGKKARKKSRERDEGRPSRVGSRAGRPVTYWTYRVTSVEEREDGRRDLVVQVKDRAGAKDAAASLLFSDREQDGWRILGLMEAKFLGVVAGQPVLDHHRLNEPGGIPRPVLPDASVIPHAFPSFPARGGEPQVYPDTRGEGEFQFAFDTVQRVVTGVRAADIRNRPDLVATLAKAGLPTEGLVHVETTRALDGRWSRQLWAPGQPWPIYGEGPSSHWHLVYSHYRHGRARRRASPRPSAPDRGPEGSP